MEFILNFSLIVYYYIIFTYFEEFLTAKYLLFKKNFRIGTIQEFGRSKIFYRSQAIREFYTIVKYRDNDEEHIVKISRSLDDYVGKKIILAVGKSNTVVRYEKCKWCNEEGENSNSKKTILVFLVFEFIALNILAVYLNEINRVYLIFLPFTIIHYLCLPFIIRLRNSLWQLN